MSIQHTCNIIITIRGALITGQYLDTVLKENKFLLTDGNQPQSDCWTSASILCGSSFIMSVCVCACMVTCVTLVKCDFALEGPPIIGAKCFIKMVSIIESILLVSWLVRILKEV